MQLIAAPVSQKRISAASAAVLKCVRIPLLLGIAVATASGATSDPVAALDGRLATGEAKLSFDPKWGYLPSILDELQVPRSSQLLVFSKTSAQFRWINPSNPRAIYFNDETYVGWVPGGPVLEISTAVPGGGAAFYTLPQQPVQSPRLVPDNGSCLQCHESARTLGVPGHLTRSVYPAADGLPHFSHGTVNVDHSTPVGDRWGGWFVTGRILMRHRGNAVGPEESFTQFASGNLARPYPGFFDTGKYLTAHSDVVAHLLLAHQTRVHNAIAKAAIEARDAMDYQREMQRLFGSPSESLLASVKRRIERPAEQLVRDLLLAGEARLDGPVKGTSGFAEEFQQRGALDGEEGSLRELDLQSRLFRYPCSYLIRSHAYAELPERVRAYVRSRFAEILAGRDMSSAFRHLGPNDRKSIREVLDRSPSLP